MLRINSYTKVFRDQFVRNSVGRYSSALKICNGRIFKDKYFFKGNVNKCPNGTSFFLFEEVKLAHLNLHERIEHETLRRSTLSGPKPMPLDQPK